MDTHHLCQHPAAQLRPQGTVRHEVDRSPEQPLEPKRDCPEVQDPTSRSTSLAGPTWPCALEPNRAPELTWEGSRSSRSCAPSGSKELRPAGTRGCSRMVCATSMGGIMPRGAEANHRRDAACCCPVFLGEGTHFRRCTITAGPKSRWWAGMESEPAGKLPALSCPDGARPAVRSTGLGAQPPGASPTAWNAVRRRTQAALSP